MSYVEVEEAEVYRGEEAAKKGSEFHAEYKAVEVLIYPKTRAVLARLQGPLPHILNWRILRQPKTQEEMPEAPRANMIPAPKVKDDTWGGAKVW